MGGHRRWRVNERGARVANGFERPAVLGAMVVNVQQWGSAGGFDQGHLQEAYELGRRSAR